MFTGIVEEVGIILKIERGVSSAVLHIKAHTVMEDLNIGDSVAVNGVCLTATRINAAGFCADVMHETLNRSSLAGLTPGAHVNLERAMAANGRFGGHIVSGHVDGTGIIQSIKRDDNAIIIRDGIIIYDGKINSLAREKDQVKEVKNGLECGITIENFNDIKENDIIEAYEVVEIKK